MYPIKFNNLYYERIWGGRALEKFRDNVPKDKIIGESWDISCHKNGIGTVVNGSLKGKKFNEIIEIYKDKLLGTKIKTKDFPLLIKLITADDKLSVQVHPNDEYASRVEKQDQANGYIKVCSLNFPVNISDVDYNKAKIIEEMIF